MDDTLILLHSTEMMFWLLCNQVSRGEEHWPGPQAELPALRLRDKKNPLELARPPPNLVDGQNRSFRMIINKKTQVEIFTHTHKHTACVRCIAPLFRQAGAHGMSSRSLMRRHF